MADGEKNIDVDLEIVATDALVEEIARRSESLLMAYVPLNGTGDIAIRSRGGIHQLAGLNELIGARVRQSIKRTTQL